MALVRQQQRSNACGLAAAAIANYSTPSVSMKLVSTDGHRLIVHHGSWLFSLFANRFSLPHFSLPRYLFSLFRYLATSLLQL